MCPVIAGVASALMGAAGAVAQYQGQKQQAEEARRSALAAHELNTTQINRRMVQEEDSANQQIREQNIEEAKLGAEAQVAAADGGVAGASLDNILADVTRSASRNREVIRTNARNTAQQLELEKKGSSSNALSRINSVPKPSALSLVAGVGGSILNGVSAYQKMK